MLSTGSKNSSSERELTRKNPARTMLLFGIFGVRQALKITRLFPQRGRLSLLQERGSAYDINILRSCRVAYAVLRRLGGGGGGNGVDLQFKILEFSVLGFAARSKLDVVLLFFRIFVDEESISPDVSA